MWIARDKNGMLGLFSSKPELNPSSKSWWTNNIASRGPKIFESPEENGVMCAYIGIEDSLFPEVTFENSPKELVIK